jgi:hypothetical protein
VAGAVTALNMVGILAAVTLAIVVGRQLALPARL